MSGKYRNDQRPENRRWSMMQRNGLFCDTSMAQLKEDIDAYYLEFSDEVLAGIVKIIKQYPAPY